MPNNVITLTYWQDVQLDVGIVVQLFQRTVRVPARPAGEGILVKVCRRLQYEGHVERGFDCDR